MPDINDLLADALETEAQGTATWVAWDTMRKGAVQSISRRKRARAIAVTGIAAASLFAVSAAAFAAVQANKDEPPVTMPTTAATLTSPSVPATASAAPDPTSTPAAVLDWATVPEDSKPAWTTDGAEGEPASRVMEPWVWDYVTDEWTPEVFADPGTVWLPLKSQALLLRAPNDDLFRIATLPTDWEATVAAANPVDQIAWLNLVQGGDSWKTVQVNLASGAVDENWLPGSLSDPYGRGWFDGVWNVGRVASLPDGRELWANYTYLGAFDGFFVREANGSWTSLAGMDEARAAVKSGSVNGAIGQGIEAWYDATSHSVTMLFQWGTYDNATFVFHTSSAQWVVVNLDTPETSPSGSIRVSDVFVPTPVLCAADEGAANATADASAPAGYTVTAICGSSRWELTPLTADVSELGSIG